MPSQSEQYCSLAEAAKTKVLNKMKQAGQNESVLLTQPAVCRAMLVVGSPGATEPRTVDAELLLWAG